MSSAAAGHLHARDLFLSEVATPPRPLLYTAPASPRSVVQMTRGHGKPDQEGVAGAGRGWRKGQRKVGKIRWGKERKWRRSWEGWRCQAGWQRTKELRNTEGGVVGAWRTSPARGQVRAR